MYQLIPLHSCDYLNKNSMKTNVATDESSCLHKAQITGIASFYSKLSHSRSKIL